jgi:hypothetical protein
MSNGGSLARLRIGLLSKTARKGDGYKIGFHKENSVSHIRNKPPEMGKRGQQPLCDSGNELHRTFVICMVCSMSHGGRPAAPLDEEECSHISIAGMSIPSQPTTACRFPSSSELIDAHYH